MLFKFPRENIFHHFQANLIKFKINGTHSSSFNNKIHKTVKRGILRLIIENSSIFMGQINEEELPFGYTIKTPTSHSWSARKYICLVFEQHLITYIFLKQYTGLHDGPGGRVGVRVRVK